MKSINKIVITGGPCAGRTTALHWIRNHFTKLGYAVLCMAETETELINSGITPEACRSNRDYQKYKMQLQLEKERIFEQAAIQMPTERVLIVCDRGAMDNLAYLSESDFASVVSYVGCNKATLRDSYDAVFHLVTAANGAETFYSATNSTEKRETIPEAIALDNKLIDAWAGHRHLYIIDNTTGFKSKIKRLLNEVSGFLGDPVPYQSNTRR